jgi:hypothetical protein
MKTALVVCFALLLAGCTPLERQAYNTVVAAKAFIGSMKAQHPECVTGATSTLCVDLTKATSAKDSLIDAAEVYCGGAQFDNGGVCTPPVKGTPASQQAAAKLKAAIAGFNQAQADLKGVVK